MNCDQQHIEQPQQGGYGRRRTATKDRTELQRLLSKRGYASRKESAALIRQGKVKVNGKAITDPCAYVPIKSKVTIDDIAVLDQTADEKILIAFHKPKGVVTTSSDERGRTTVYDLLPDKYRDLKAVGRLDLASSGLLLFTNDNALADSLLNPNSKIPRTYVVGVKGAVTSAKIERLLKGVKDGPDILRADSIVLRKVSGKESTLIITLTEGKNREIRRMCESLGHVVIKLKRISFGEISLGDLAVGAVRVIAL